MGGERGPVARSERMSESISPSSTNDLSLAFSCPCLLASALAATTFVSLAITCDKYIIKGIHHWGGQREKVGVEIEIERITQTGVVGLE